ncbi:hypothetical protein CBR_g58698, partial [Chara braunii]
MEFRRSSEYEETTPPHYGDCVSRVLGRASVLMTVLMVTLLVVATVLSSCLGAGPGWRAVSSWHREDRCRSAGIGCENRIRAWRHAGSVSDAHRTGSASLEERTYNSRSLKVRDPILPAIRDPELIVNKTKVFTLTDSTLKPVFPASISNSFDLVGCNNALEDLGLASNGSVLYYVLDQRCNSQLNGSDSEEFTSSWLYSVRKAERRAGSGGWEAFQNDSLITYWWAFNDSDGMRPSSPIIFNENSTMETMMGLIGMDLSDEGTTLVLTTETYEALG